MNKMFGKMIRRVWALVVGVVLVVNCVPVVGVFAETNESDFEFDSSTGTITGYNGSGEDIVIPSSIGEVKVKNIGNSAFSFCFSLTSIEIPNTVTNIGDSAFSDCTSLKSVKIPNSVTSIGNSAFSFCNSLESIEISNSVISIGD